MLPFTEAIEDFLAFRAAENLSPSSIKQYRSYLGGLVRVTRGSWPGYQDLNRWLRSIQHLAPSTRHHRVSVIKQMLRWAVDQEYIATDPARRLPMPRRPRPLPKVLTDEDMERLVSGRFKLPYRWGERHLGARDKLIIRLLLMTGLRRAEVSALNVEDIDPAHQVLYVRQGKGRKDRVVRMPQALVRDLAAFTRGRRPDEPLFQSRSAGKRLQPNGVGEIFTVKVSQVFGKRVHTHLLRHAYATHLSRQGVPLRVIQEMLGHASLQTTQIYLQVTAQDQILATDALDSLFERASRGVRRARRAVLTKRGAL